MNMMQSMSLLLMTVILIFTANVHASPYDDDAYNCFALNLYWEARSEGREGMMAVGWVVLNRMSSAKYPDSVCAVIHQGGERPPCEFNWWCDGRSDRPTEPRSWKIAQQITDQMLSDPPPDPTDGALWFHLDSIQVPNWLRPRERTLHLRRHYFYR
jgi:spore germination cell wall hydrolase CwlJ-like protein